MPETWLCVAHEKEIPDFAALATKGYTPLALGIGQFHALIRFSELAALQKPAAVILAGTCGALHEADVSRIFLCNHFAFSAVAGEETPDFLEQAFTTENPRQPLLPDLPSATVLQNYGVSLDAQKFAANAANIPAQYPRPILENMEAASLAVACNRLQIPFAAVLCVTNTVAADARQQWKKNFSSAGKLLRDALAG